MKRQSLLLAALLACATPTFAEDSSPHHMMDADGALDDTACGFCHDDEFGLLRAKLETCTMCHSTTPHAGAAEHLRASPAAVAHLLKATPDGAEVPLTDGGAMYCGSCHLFHDPAMAGEEWLASGWLPSGRFAKSVRDALDQRLEKLAGESSSAAVVWADTGTRALRLPVSDGTLCKRCHAGMVP